jgi:hypothetical protein
MESIWSPYGVHMDHLLSIKSYSKTLTYQKKPSDTHTGCPITHGIHCKKSVKTNCQFLKNGLEEKKVKFNVKKPLVGQPFL